MDRRRFLQTGGVVALALSGVHRYSEAFARTRLRAGVIGTGWYGKSVLFLANALLRRPCRVPWVHPEP